jgi:hypothetical protein
MFGAVTGLAGALLAFLVLGFAGLENDLRGQSVLIFLLYAAFLVAGYIAGRSAPDRHVLHGGVSAMVLFAVQVILAGADAVAIVVGGITAVVIGSAGGALGQFSRERTSGGSQDPR